MAWWSLFFSLVCMTFCSCGGYGRSEEIAMLTEEVRYMHDCQQRAQNREFYLHKYKAEKIIERYAETFPQLPEELQHAYVLARCRYAFTLSDYMKQVGYRHDAISVMDDLSANSSLNISADTVQWLNYLYHQAAARFTPVYVKNNAENLRKGYDCLIQCYILSTRRDIKKYRSRSMIMLSRYLINDSIFSLAKDFDAASLRYINEDGVADSLLAGNLAERALHLATELDDEYLEADAWRNLASCYFDIDDAGQSVYCLLNALKVKGIDSLPDLKARIHEQLSMSYAALNDKHFSDLYRNAYLDMQDSTRQDRELEARAETLRESTQQIWYLISGACVLLVMLTLMVIVLTRLRKRKDRKAIAEEEEIEELQELVRSMQLRCSNAQRAAVEQRARVAIVNGMLPLIDRMKIAVNGGNYEYATELAHEIENQNAMLTRWVKMRQGSVAPVIENFPMQDVLDVMAQSVPSLLRSGIRMTIPPTELRVTADKILTLFIVNTLTDNARKAMPDGGEINIGCEGNAEGKYAEISISDTGRGMTEEQTEHLFEYRPIVDEEQVPESGERSSHGFGLQNCRGIIERYRKQSALFSVCQIKAESVQGRGTKISFRLPLAMKVLLVVLSFFCTISLHANEAVRYADSLYECNVQGRYDQGMVYADSCLDILKHDTLVSDEVRLSVYNETAVAALALHQWHKYRYYNYMYNLLYKKYTTDKSLPTYCETLENNRMTANYIMFVVLLLMLALVPIFWFTYLRHVVRRRSTIRQQKAELMEALQLARHEYNRLHVNNNIIDNQLSTLKHETMYYPTLVRQQISRGEDTSEIQSTVGFYRDMFAMLSSHAMGRQTNKYSFPMSACPVSALFKDVESDVQVLCNAELMQYLCLLLKRHNGGRAPQMTLLSADGGYAHVSAAMTSPDYDAAQAEVLFATSTPNADFLIMRQIMRETGNTTNRYGCGIRSVLLDGESNIQITLPITSDPV